MSFKDTEKSTFRERQRHMFISSLYEELEKNSVKANNRNSSLYKRAESLFLEERYSKDNCVDILVLEGFPSDLSRQYVNSLDTCKKEASTNVDVYDYDFEDHKGMIFSGKELGDLVEASSQEEAEDMIKVILSSFDPPVSLLGIKKCS